MTVVCIGHKLTGVTGGPYILGTETDTWAGSSWSASELKVYSNLGAACNAV
jgi:hypothetical protein